MSRIHIITAVHNDLSNLKKLLSCFDKQKYKSFTITVVDDGSSDSVHEYLSTAYPKIHYLAGNGQLWWTGSLNLGISHVLAFASSLDYILTINNDCVVGPDYLTNLFKHRSRSLVIGSKILDAKTKKVWDLGVILDWRRGKILPRHHDSDPLDALTTKGTLYPVSMFNKIGLLSPKLPHYISDYEISIRAKRSGYELVLCSDCIVLNDTKNTGVGDNLKEYISWRDVIHLMFNRRSKLNIVDHFWFITLCCPLGYKPLNYLRLLAKTIYLLVLPFPFIHKLAKLIKRGYNS